jgi:hypothetical protein
LFGKCLADLLDGCICRIDWCVAQILERDAEADGRVFQVEVDHVEVVLEAFGESFCDATDKVLVLAKAHGGDIGELVVFVDEARVGVRGVTAASEDVEDGDGVARGKPVGDRDGERKGRVVAVRREDEDLQVRLLQNDFIYVCPAGRARYARRGHFVTCVPCLGE